MSKPPRPKLQGLIAPAPSHNQANAQSHDNSVVQLRDDDVPDAPLVPTPSVERPIRPQPRRGRAAKPAELEPADYAHRSLYARHETLELIRRIAFEENVSAQSLYREGLFLMLRKRGYYRDKQLDDV